jgi:restriction system protein
MPRPNGTSAAVRSRSVRGSPRRRAATTPSETDRVVHACDRSRTVETVAEITRQRGGEIVRGVLTVLLEHPEGVEAHAVIAKVGELVGVTEYEAADYPSTPGRRRFDKIVRFATIPAVKAGWMVKSKGIWTATTEGQAALEHIADPAEFMRESVRRYRAWKKSQPSGESNEGLDDVSSDEETAGDEPSVLATSELEEATEAAWSGIRSYITGLNAYTFQDLAAALIEGMGYHIAWISPPGPDQGLDILAYRDPLGTADPPHKGAGEAATGVEGYA